MKPAPEKNSQNDHQFSADHAAARIMELHESAGRCFQARDAAQAQDLLRQIIALAPDDAAAHANLGLVLHTSGAPMAAIAAYQDAIALEPGHFHLHFLLGSACKELGLLGSSTTQSMPCLNSAAFIFSRI